ncbi:MAG: ferredoxin [Patescibacteria group bacterium]
MRVKVDRDLCISAADCLSLVPEVFELDEEGKAVIKSLSGDKTSDWVDVTKLPADVQTILAAAKACPTGAIIIEDDNGQQLCP